MGVLEAMMNRLFDRVKTELFEEPSQQQPTPEKQLPEKSPPPKNEYQEVDISYPPYAPANQKAPRAEDIGFFDPEHRDVNGTANSGPITNAGKHVIYRDVYVFVDRLKDIAYLHGDDMKHLIPECLRGAALMWYTVELTDLEKSSLRATPDPEQWYTTLINRFKTRTSVALAYLTSSTYSLRDINNMLPRMWIQDML